jgi:hypothetical protein
VLSRLKQGFDSPGERHKINDLAIPEIVTGRCIFLIDLRLFRLRIVNVRRATIPPLAGMGCCAMFGLKMAFGKKKQSFSDLKDMMRPTPDADGVTRVFSKELWDDPKIGSMLRQLGFAPDDARNVMRTADDYIALFATAKKRLEARVEAFNSEMAARHGYCRAAPFLVIDRTIWDGEHGAFLYAQMDLVGFDDWNVLMLAADVRTKEACGLAGHPGSIPAVTEVVTKRVVDWKARYESVLEAFGVTATGGQGITREQYAAEKDALRKDIVDQVAWMKPRIVSELLRVQA